MFSNDADFAILFLERLGAGLHGDRVRMSRLDSEVVMRTYRECVMYLMTRFQPVETLCPVFSQVGGRESGACMQTVFTRLLNICYRHYLCSASIIISTN